ncbi:MAG: di-trans,poly-cis-decaprenylcistransferase [Firmicutes bacterium HGW-Firmicutes-1]|jgi:undecaprenyl diphosphate synthase|nr:MAG: di-trans,poly-cis-decaprenylcistransferase [Firmicutes bacterium HGW-Firmicutes-1]
MGQRVSLKDCVIPKHIAFIMDGNGRWAKERGKKRTWGHKEGSNVLKKICRDAYQLGVEYVTVYAFSTENWQRPEEEVDFLMDLLRQYLKESVKTCKKDNMRVRVIGNKEGLPLDVQDTIKELELESSGYTGLNLQIALNYGGRDEILRAIKNMSIDLNQNQLSINDLDEERFSSYLDTKEIPDPDLMIRTSGEIRLSNFLLWQLAYSEFYFTQKYWPDFKKEDLVEAIQIYNKKERRYGGLIDED